MKNLLTTLLLIAKSLIHSDLYKNNLLPSYYYLLPLTTLYINICKLLHWRIMFFYMYSNCLCCVLCCVCALRLCSVLCCTGVVMFSVYSVFCSVCCMIVVSVFCTVEVYVLHICLLCLCIVCAGLCAYCVRIVCVLCAWGTGWGELNSIRYPPCWLPMRVYGKNY